MTVPDEEVFAFVDGELPPEAMARIEAAMVTDPQLALRVETQRALRRLLSGAHAGVMRGTPPEQLTAAVTGTAPQKPAAKPPPKPAEVIAFPGPQAKAKAKPKAREPKLAKPPGAAGRGFPIWAAMAACLVGGLIIGRVAVPVIPTLSGADDPSQIAAGPLAQALNTQASGRGAGAIRIGLSFKDQAGLYCRTFQALGRAPVAGVACREPSAWRVRAISPASPASDTAYRTAGSETPAAVLAAVDAMIAGQPLDAAGEAQAKAAGWKPVRGGAAPR
uniref:Putative transmembrane anti-sigma factor n=1 Tax=Caulobacter sp. (strain K31) TaxID=366602 RepID=B0SYM3_CAUSK